MKIVVAIPHSHTWLWTQTCLSSLLRNPPMTLNCDDVTVVVVNNSLWSPSIKGITETSLGDGITIIDNCKTNRFHASALDHVVETFDFDYLMTLETDVMVLRPTWLQWFIDQMKSTDYAVGMWHHEQFINPSCTLYRGDVLRDMKTWCYFNPNPNEMCWGENFSKSQLVTDRNPEKDYVDWYDNNIAWIAGPFAERRGWPEGTKLKEQPTGQMKGPGWYEPGQQLHHWAVEAGCTYTVCPTFTTKVNEIPVQTLYDGSGGVIGRQLEAHELFNTDSETVHLWGGTRALDIIKHEVHDPFIIDTTPMWLAREARFWRQVVPKDVQEQTLELIRKYGWHITGQGNLVAGGDERDRRAAEYVKKCYEAGGVTW